MKKIVHGEYEKIKSKNFNCQEFTIPNLFVGRKNDEVILRKRKMRSQMNQFKLSILYI